jgi:pilus assembly protein CpaB
MRVKILLLIVALILGGLAAVMAAQYLNSARTRIEAESQPMEVLVATEDIPRGVQADDLVERGLIEIQEVPAQFVAAGAISSANAIEGQVLAVPLTEGEQITRSRFQFPSTAGLAYSIPDDYLALTIAVNEVKGVAGLLKPGDHVAAFVTFTSGAEAQSGSEGKELTQMLLPRARVLAAGQLLDQFAESGGEEEQPGGLASRQTQQESMRTVTLSLSPVDAERLVFAEEIGNVWLALVPATATDVPQTSGQTIDTVLE